MKGVRLLTTVFSISFFFVGNPVYAETGSANGKSLVIISGADSHVVKPSLELATTPEKWKQTCARHQGTTTDDIYAPAIEVDFDRCLVVAIFRGAQQNVSGVQITSTETEESITIRLNDVTYQTAGKDNNHAADRPYAFVVLPKSSKAIVVEENVQQYKGQPPKWKEWARIEKRKP